MVFALAYALALASVVTYDRKWCYNLERHLLTTLAVSIMIVICLKKFFQQIFQFVFDIYAKYVPQPVDIKTQQSVYDHYDILEEIGTGAFGVVHRCRLAFSWKGEGHSGQFVEKLS